ncbi:hypothetical protein Q7C36_000354 [Tachysurus vachellii]|uniref:Immunoglobulin domain-containing protein n=1 Tax=Tachysurus vachellii TaxID=175792 RepID=A0AA88P1L2_TACVA|nr:hypothetical protein Q7C36_000354 [Tachysurus vachellii]
MALVMQLDFFLSVLVSVTVCDDVFKLVNSSVQLDILKKETVSEDIDWTFKPKTLIVRYNGNPPSRVYGSYKERVEFNEETYSLTLMNLQKSDSGIYEAEVAGETKDVVAKYQLHVLDPVEKPVLTASLQSNDFCNVTLTCEAQKLSVTSHCYNDNCGGSTTSFLTNKLQYKMAMAMQLVFFLYMLVPITVCDDVFKLVNSSVQLDIPEHLDKSFDLFWTFNKDINIVRYIENSPTKVFDRYKDRVEFNEETYSLTLKNLQKSDSGIYEAKEFGDRSATVATYQLKVLDPVEKPVLTASLQRGSTTSFLTNKLQYKMAMAMQLVFFLYMLVPITVCDDVFKLVNSSVQLDIREHFDKSSILFWTFKNKDINIVRYIRNSQPKVPEEYKERVEFNEETYSLTLKNLQKSDSGIYEAKALEERIVIVATYQLKVLDPVEKPVLTASLQMWLRLSKGRLAYKVGEVTEQSTYLGVGIPYSRCPLKDPPCE